MTAEVTEKGNLSCSHTTFRATPSYIAHCSQTGIRINRVGLFHDKKYEKGISFGQSSSMKNCSYCGRENTEVATHCQECGTEFNFPDTSPLTSNQDKAPAAGFWIRALARILDTVFGLVVGFAAGSLAGIVIVILNVAGIVPPGWQSRIHQFSLTSLGFSFLGMIAYHFFCEGIHGATLGKLCCGIRVVSEDGSPSTLKGALIRTLAYFIDALFFGLVGYNSMQKSPLKQRYGDVWGKTAVFKTKEMAPESQRTTRFLLGLFLGVGCWIVLLAIGLILKIL